jgi:hypothetical protein
MATLSGRIQDIANARWDMAAPQSLIRLDDDCYHFSFNLDEPLVTDSGVITGPLSARYTERAFRAVAQRLDIPPKYLMRLAYEDNSELNVLAAHNVNTLAALSPKGALYRFLHTEDEGLLLRAVVSDKFLTLDSDTALVAIVKGLQNNSLDIGDAEVEADWTMDRLRMRIHVPQVGVSALDLLRDYKSPFDGKRAEKMPMLFAGVEIANSDTGNGAFSVAPRAVFEVCSNGMRKSVEFRRTHIGAQLETGVIDWSSHTFEQALGMLQSQVTDAVATFISEDYLNRVVQEMQAAADTDLPSPRHRGKSWTW